MPSYKNIINDNTGYSGYISSDFTQFYYFDTSWLTYRPPTLYNLYPVPLEVIQDPCYSGYTYADPNFEGTYYGVSYTPDNRILFVYKQFNTDILFQSIYPPTSLFQVPTKSTNIILVADLINTFTGINVSNTDETNLLLTTN